MTCPPADTRIGHYENFPVASLLCPAHLRAPIAAIYHFARSADDIADEGEASAAEQHAVEQPATATPEEDKATAPTGQSTASTTSPDPEQDAPAATDPPAATDNGLTTKSNPDPGHRYPGSGFVGTGRDGLGQVGKGGSGQEAQPITKTQPQNKPRRRRPRTRGRN